jgi:hypothetical protein
MALPRRSRGLLRLLAVLALALAVGAQFPKKDKVKAPAVKSDVKCVAAARSRAFPALTPAAAGTSAAACARSWPRTWRAS